MNAKVTALKAAVLTSVNLTVQALMAMSAHASATTIPDTYAPATTGSIDVATASTSELEASFIKVSANCKASHAAFEAVRFGIEDIAPEVRAIHAEIEAA